MGEEKGVVVLGCEEFGVAVMGEVVLLGRVGTCVELAPSSELHKESSDSNFF